MDVTNKEHFRIIRKAIENNKLALFVGSAVSFDSNLPSWGELISLMKNALELPRTDDYLKIAEHYYLQYGRNTYYSKIKDFFPTGSQPNSLHKLLLSLKPQHIITTNWDDLLEKSISNNGDLYFTVASDHELASSPSSQLLVKMHGDLAHRNIVFKESDYLAYTDKFPLIENFIKSLFSTHIVIFIGYSISDYNLNQILSWIRNRTEDAPPAFTILTESKITLSESNYLREKGVYPLLCEESLKDNQEHPELSSKSNRVARIIEKIICPESTEVLDILAEIAVDISSWETIYPSIFVQLLKNRFNITEINKIYYDSINNVINYNLSDQEKLCSRNEVRKIRAKLIKILPHIPVEEVRFSVSHDKYYRIKNTFKFYLVDEYTSFDFNNISERVSAVSLNLSHNHDKYFQYAYDNYYLKRLHLAREAFTHVANMYFSKSLFIKSLVSSFNKKQLCFGEMPWEISSYFFQTSMEEQLLRNDNISEMIEKFPKSIVARQKPLFHGLDSNNSFLLERFRSIANLSREIDEEIDNINNGAMVFSSKQASMYNQAYCIVIFITKNRITTIYSDDYKNICKIAFEAIIKRQCLENKVELDVLLSYIAIVSFKEKDLVKFLSDRLNEGKSLEITEDTIKYIFLVLDNLIKTISSKNPPYLIEYCIRVWSNALILLSYAKHSEFTIKEIIRRSTDALDTTKWFLLSEAINRFLVFQVNRYGCSFSLDDLKLLFDKQVEKINLNENIPLQERGRLFSNLLYLISDNTDGASDIFKGNRQLERFISSIEAMDFKERVRAINGFVFVTHSLAIGNLKSKITKLLKQTFEESKGREFDETSITFGLDLYNIEVLQKKELDFVMSKLKIKVDEHLEKGSTTTNYPIIKEQLGKINKENLKGFEDVVEGVTKLATAIEDSFNWLNNKR
ncbi:SIR2 family protein [Methylophaga sp.]|uniref:SIR2 family NAD-dependent protein deacylase n=1 Tax=Methylophaga sp. TaxID=2024840 RepID=UPI0027225AA2|nr:SIR2 family protein [Methylophaga sp.]MDO8826147.1 SIR2 family protein [Methylophaga sp.]